MWLDNDAQQGPTKTIKIKEIFDKIGLTNELEGKIKTKFENNEIEENLSKKPKNNLKKNMDKTLLFKNIVRNYIFNLFHQFILPPTQLNCM